MHKVLVLLAGLSIGACATASAPTTARVKPGLTAEIYAADNAACAEAAAAARADANNDLRVNPQSDYGRAGAGGGSSSAGGSNDLSPVGTAGAEVNINMYDVTALARYNAAVAARNQAEARARAAGACMDARGYRQIVLSPEQAAKLAATPEGGAARAQALSDLAAP